ncbi:hypothetical protein PybrP1_001052 [[Pythium] brassicae (nom. inval.)]|nr:hypothetical protein PybrP1_001052 [[Pythium] brassicae (nom. inval.)]
MTRQPIAVLVAAVSCALASSVASLGTSEAPAPVVLRVDVRREARVQLRSFCHAHGLDHSLCGDGLLEAIREVVDLEHICRSWGRTLESPAFVVGKNVIWPSGNGQERAPSFSWLQDGADHIATDLCRFAQLPSPEATLTCTTALESAIQRSTNADRRMGPGDISASETALSHQPTISATLMEEVNMGELRGSPGQ